MLRLQTTIRFKEVLDRAGAQVGGATGTMSAKERNLVCDGVYHSKQHLGSHACDQQAASLLMVTRNKLNFLDVFLFFFTLIDLPFEGKRKEKKVNIGPTATRR